METSKPFRVDDVVDFGSCGLETTLVCFIFNNKLFVFCNLTQPVNFIGSDYGWELSGILSDNKRSFASRDRGVVDFFKDHANVPMVNVTIGGWDSSKQCFEFMGELAQVFSLHQSVQCW